jgi:hypothetical protein
VNRFLTPFLIAAALMALLAARPVASFAKDGDGEVRTTGTCGGGVASELRLKSEDGGIELRFKLRHSRAGSVWRISLVQERRIAWKGTAKTAGSSGSFELRRTLQDLPGADAVSVRALGPRGLVCRATATILES